MVACVPGWEGSGGPIDLVAGLPGTLVGTGSTYLDGPIGHELSFNAASSYVSFGDQTKFATPLNGSVTFAAMHTPTSTTQTALWGYAGSASAARCPFTMVYSLGGNSTYSFWNDNNADAVIAAAASPINNRYFVVGRRIGDHASPTMSIYVDGRLSATANPALSATWDAADSGYIQAINRLGAFAGYMGTGSISNIMVWDRALSDIELSALFSDPYGPIRQQRSEFVFLFGPIGPPPSTERVSPSSISVQTNLSGAVAAIQDDPDSPDASWLTATSVTSATELRAGFVSPVGTLSGSQNFRLRIRKTAGSANPTVTAQLYQAGTLRKTLQSGVAITSTTGVVLQGDWLPSDLVATTGSDVEIRIVSVPGASTANGATPAYAATGQAGAVANATITATIAPAKPSTVNAGDLLILHVLARNSNNNGAGPASITGWTSFSGNPYGGTNNARTSLYWRIAGAGEASQTVSFACTGGTTSDLAMARIYRFTAANGFDPTNPVEAITSRSGTATPMLAPATITPVSTNRRAVCCGSIATNSATVGNMTGETGGDWTQATNANSATGGTGTLNLQTSDQSAGGAISGGSIAVTTGNWVTIGFMLVPAIVAGANENTVEVGAVEWNASYLAPEIIDYFPPYPFPQLSTHMAL